MKRTYKITIMALIALFAFSCRKYVEIEQQSVRTLKYTSDYRYTLNYSFVIEGSFGYPILAGDDALITDPTRVNAMGDIIANVYTWAAKNTSETQSDADWEKLYKTIYTCNEVLAGVMESQGGSDIEKKQLFGEALVHRAYAYLILTNMYGKQYNSATAASDLAVPLLTTPNLFVPLNRATVAQVYDKITEDLLSSVDMLPALPDFNTRPAKVSAYALLARAYLNMRNFTKSGEYADKALALQSTLLDLKTYESAPGTVPVRLKDPEVILSKIATGSYTAISINDDLLNSMAPNDLRYKLFTNTRATFGTQFSTAFTGRAYSRYILNGEFVIVNGPSVPEMMLISAESKARAGNFAGAITDLNNLRMKRFTTANYVALNASSADEALRLVVEERKKEFMGTGNRWFDQKRLNLDPAFAAAKTRTFKTVNYSIEPNSNRYLFPIGDKYILLNPEIVQNPR